MESIGLKQVHLRVSWDQSKSNGFKQGQMGSNRAYLAKLNIPKLGQTQSKGIKSGQAGLKGVE